MHIRQFIPVIVLIACLPLAAARAQNTPRPGQGPVFGQSAENERFERQLDQIRRDTELRIDNRIPPEQRALIDYGAFLTFTYVSLDDPNGDNHVLRQYDVVGYARMNLDGAQELFIRGRTGYRDFNDGDSFDGRGDEIIDPDLDRAYYRFDLNRYQASRGWAQSDLGMILQGGRDLVYWGNGLTIGQVLDGVRGDFFYGPFTLELIAGVTPTRTVDIDSSRPNFDHNTRRGFYGAMLSRRTGTHQPYVYGLLQRDYNQDDFGTISGINTSYDYNSHYIAVGSSGSLTDRLLYGIELVYQGGSTLSNSFIIAGPNLVQIEQSEDSIYATALDARLDYLLNDERRTRFSGELIAASGDPDRQHTTNTFGGNVPGTSDRSFNAFGLIDTGTSFAPSVSNIIVIRGGGVTFPLPDHGALRKFQIGADVFFYGKMDQNAPIDEFTLDKRYLGWEPDVFVNWEITSDVTLAVRYGVFFPGAAIPDDEPRHFISAGVTYAF